MLDIKKLYDKRFTTIERIRKRQLWKILCRNFLQKFIGRTKTIVDVSPDIKKYADKDVQAVIAPIKKLKNIFPENSVDIIFMSNLLEHLDNKEDVFRLLHEAYGILKKGGRLLIMQPDIALV